MNLKTFGQYDVIFREGDPGDCMYDIEYGKVGIFKDYGGKDEKKIAELFPGQLFGEMGLIDGALRSATAVALTDETVLDIISENDFYSYFEKKPYKILLLMQQMCNRLRRTTRNYMEACRTVYETVETEKAGKKKSQRLLESIRRFCAQYNGFNINLHS